jgi:hypothetical protein
MRKTSASLYDFIIRPLPEISSIGIVGGGFFGFCLLGSSYAGQLNGFLIFVFGGLFLLSVLLILFPIKGFWDEHVIGDKIKFSRLWVIHRTINFDEIDYCFCKRGGIKIRLKSGHTSLFGIDGLTENIETFMERLEQENILLKEKKELRTFPEE